MTARQRFAGRLIACLLAVAGSAMIAAGFVLPERMAPPAPAPVLAEGIPPALPAAVSTIRQVSRPLGRSVPVHLDVPAIGVHTGLVPLGLNPDGTVALPPLTAHAPAGWYRYLATPGEAGPAVILGHVDTAWYGPAVFFRLGALRRGDRITVARADGSRVVFAVTAVVQYPKTTFPASAVYGATDYPALRLVTCGGQFDRASGSYRANIVVFAELVGR